MGSISGPGALSIQSRIAMGVHRVVGEEEFVGDQRAGLSGRPSVASGIPVMTVHPFGDFLVFLSCEVRAMWHADHAGATTLQRRRFQQAYTFAARQRFGAAGSLID